MIDAKTVKICGTSIHKMANKVRKLNQPAEDRSEDEDCGHFNLEDIGYVIADGKIYDAFCTDCNRKVYCGFKDGKVLSKWTTNHHFKRR